MTRCFITGATGFVGGFVAEEAMRRGWEVVCLARSAARAERMRALGAEIVIGDVDDLAALRRGVESADLVVHAAGLVKARSAGEFHRVNHLGTENVLDVCARRGGEPPRVLVVSSLAAAGPARGGVPVAEDDPPRPVSVYGESKRRGEAAALARAGELPIVVVRPGMVYGPRDREGLLAFRLVRIGVRPRVPVRSISVVHVRDLTELIFRALASERALGRVYFAANPEPVATLALAETIARALDRRTVVVPIPVLGLRAAAAVSGVLGRLTNRAVMFDPNKLAELLQEAWVCSSRRAGDELGWRAAVALEDGIRETAHWHRENGWL